MPLFDPSFAGDLRPWLIRTLQPICDADPDKLADYIIALLKQSTEDADLKNLFETDLYEFLQQETKQFVDALFSALRSKSYIPYAPASSSASSSKTEPKTDSGIPLPLDLISPTAPQRGIKRSSSQDIDERQYSKGPRMNNGSRGRGRGGYMNGHGMDGGREICRDFHFRGFCNRADSCPFSHEQMMPMPGPMHPGMMPMMPFFSMYPGMMTPAFDPQPYNPNDSVMDMRRLPDATGIQDLTPEATTQPHPRPETNGQHHSPMNGVFQRQIPPHMQPPMQLPVQPPMQPFPDNDVHMQPMDGASPPIGSRPPRGRGGGRGAVRRSRGGGGRSMRDMPTDEKTIVVEGIPAVHLSVPAVTEYFARFGTVTNAAVDSASAQALVTFSNYKEAEAAWGSEEAYFGNRFVKTFWHRPMEGHGTEGARKLEASAGLVANVQSKEAQTAPASNYCPPRPKPKTVSGPVTAQQKKLEARIAEQKILFSRLKTATPDEKKTIMARLKQMKEEDDAPATEPSTSNSVDRSMPVEANAKEETPSDAAPSGSGDKEASVELQAELAALRAQAEEMGVPTDESQPDNTYYQSSYRGRGRGRGFRGGYRGRGSYNPGPPRASMKLDNRPRKLSIHGLNARDEEVIQSVRAWFEMGGQVDSVDAADDSIIVGFKTRNAAEQALARGGLIPDVGDAKLSWHSETSIPAPPSTSKPAEEDTKHHEPIPASPTDEVHHTSTDSSKWDRAEDDDGMTI